LTIHEDNIIIWGLPIIIVAVSLFPKRAIGESLLWLLDDIWCISLLSVIAQLYRDIFIGNDNTEQL
jgi:hypothetical protein